MRLPQKKSKISFIVIGKNEGWKLTLCFKSIQNAVSENNILDYEIIYVDSRSTDDSLKRASYFPNLRRYIIIGDCNAAIARNIGGKEASGEILVFLDGDMEIQSEFISELFDKKDKLIHNFISAIYYHWYYNQDWVLKNNEKPILPSQSRYKPIIGGFFVITKQLWDSVGGMDTSLIVSEDHDLGLRLAENDSFVLLMNCIGVNHHMISYDDRIKSLFFKTRYNAYLLKKHFFNKYFWIALWRNNLTVYILLTTLFFTFLSPQYIYTYICIYILAVIVRTLSRKNSKMFQRFFFLISRDIFFIISLLFFFPKKKVIRYMKF